MADLIDRANTANTGRLSGPNPFGTTKFADRNWDILDALKAVATELERPPAQATLAWTLARPGVVSTLVGASKLSQLEKQSRRNGNPAQQGLDETPG